MYRSAKKKIGRIAAFHDPKKNSFSGFDSEALNPTEFREQLRRNFSVVLDDAELGATIMLFDKVIHVLLSKLNRYVIVTMICTP